MVRVHRERAPEWAGFTVEQPAASVRVLPLRPVSYQRRSVPELERQRVLPARRANGRRSARSHCPGASTPSPGVSTSGSASTAVCRFRMGLHPPSRVRPAAILGPGPWLHVERTPAPAYLVACYETRDPSRPSRRSSTRSPTRLRAGAHRGRPCRTSASRCLHPDPARPCIGVDLPPCSPPGDSLGACCSRDVDLPTAARGVGISRRIGRRASHPPTSLDDRGWHERRRSVRATGSTVGR